MKRKPIPPVNGELNEKVKGFLPIVRSVVDKITLGNVPSPAVGLDDLVNVGLFGAFLAIKFFDPKFGTSLETYVRLRVRGAVLDELRRFDDRTRTERRKLRSVEQASAVLRQRLEREPTRGEVCRELKIEDPKAFFGPLDAYTDTVSFDVADDPEMSLKGRVVDESTRHPGERVDAKYFYAIVVREISGLRDMPRKVIALYFFEGLKFREIGEVFGFTEARAQQICLSGIETLRFRMRGLKKEYV